MTLPPKNSTKVKKLGGRSTAARSIGSDQQDVGPSGVATGRGVFNLSSSSPVGMKKTPTD
ncbi:hypothetical protein [Rummeliibacillus suwonensis]|uniref:hypothetical protein n=1 Tax=Rummeliibacillus suwonensis TaxID=1306154 RepID=UPI001FB8F410|nr:hypothetical protein [Rummeliibacillus suwonensis]